MNGKGSPQMQYHSQMRGLAVGLPRPVGVLGGVPPQTPPQVVASPVAFAQSPSPQASPRSGQAQPAGRPSLFDQPQPTSPQSSAAGQFGTLHPLQQPWTFWFDRRPSKGKRMPGEKEAYESNLVQVGTVATVESFWQYFNHITKPTRLENNANISFFKNGVKPMWEDAANVKGGKWIIQFRSGERALLDNVWEEILLGMIGEYLDPDEEICGVVISKRSRGDKIAVWNKNKGDESKLLELGARLREVCKTKTPLQMEYQHHEDSMRTGASYTNPSRLELRQ